MKAISKKIRQTGVKLLSTVFILSTLAPNVSFAADPAPYQYMGGDCAFSDEAKRQECLDKKNSASICERKETELKEANNSIKEACSKAGLKSANRCLEAALTCDEDVEDEPVSGRYGLTQAVATITGQTIPETYGSDGSCPQYSGQDYADKKKDIDDDIKEINEDLADLTKEQGEIKAQYSKDIQEIKKDINDSQAELEKQKKALSAEQRADLEAKQKEQAQNAETLEQLGMSKMDLENKLTQAQIDQATELIKYSDSAVSVECLKQAQEYKASVKALYKRGTGSGSLVMAGKGINTAAAAKAKACVATFQKARIKIMTAGESQQKLLRAQIESTANKIANLRVQIETATANFATTQTEQTAAQTDAENQVIKKMQLAAEEMQSLATKLQDDGAAIAQKQQNLKQALLRANNRLSELTAGGTPRSGSQQSVAEASATIGSDVETVKSIIEGFGDKCEGLKSAYYKAAGKGPVPREDRNVNKKGSSGTKTTK